MKFKFIVIAIFSFSFNLAFANGSGGHGGFTNGALNHNDAKTSIAPIYIDKISGFTVGEISSYKNGSTAISIPKNTDIIWSSALEKAFRKGVDTKINSYNGLDYYKQGVATFLAEEVMLHTNSAEAYTKAAGIIKDLDMSNYESIKVKENSNNFNILIKK